jgi:glycerol transport system ATP-binding protein
VVLQGIGLDVAGRVHLHPLDLTLVPGSLNVLLGATRAGKTSLMRLIAGLEPPTCGQVLEGGRDVTGVAVRRRQLAMVYQQFINYPSLSVRENIASPLRLRRCPAPEIRTRVDAIAAALHLTPYLDRRPGELSGGQQQRTALARALAKDAPLLLLDEPLGNLDYKLREELRAELLQLLQGRRTTVVYATTEPQEALQLGGHVAVLVEGRLVQAGPTLEVFSKPASLVAAQAFSDPPLNVLAAVFDAEAGAANMDAGSPVPLAPSIVQRLRAAGVRELRLASRPYQLRLEPTDRATQAFEGTVELAELNGSETFLHVRHGSGSLVAQLPGVHRFTLGSQVRLHVDPRDFHGFAVDGARLFAAGEG